MRRERDHLPHPLDEESRAERFIETYLTFTKGQSAERPFKLESWQLTLFPDNGHLGYAAQASLA